MSGHEFIYGGHDPYEGVAVRQPVDPQTWGGRDDIFADLAKEVRPKVIVEVGTWLGASAITMAKAAPDAHVFCVDTWLGRPAQWKPFKPHLMLGLRNGRPTLYERFLENIVAHGLADRVTPVPLPSLLAAQVIGQGVGQGPDLVYIDGAHDYDSVRSDINAWDALLAPRGTIFGHDHSTCHPGVVRAVHEAFGCYADTSREPFWVVRPRFSGMPGSRK